MEVEVLVFIITSTQFQPSAALLARWAVVTKLSKERMFCRRTCFLEYMSFRMALS